MFDLSDLPCFSEVEDASLGISSRLTTVLDYTIAGVTAASLATRRGAHFLLGHRGEKKAYDIFEKERTSTDPEELRAAERVALYVASTGGNAVGAAVVLAIATMTETPQPHRAAIAQAQLKEMKTYRHAQRAHGLSTDSLPVITVDPVTNQVIGARAMISAQAYAAQQRDIITDARNEAAYEQGHLALGCGAAVAFAISAVMARGWCHEKLTQWGKARYARKHPD